MKQRTFDAAAHVAHMEAVMGLTIMEGTRPSVLAHMEAIAKAGELLMAFPLDDEIEPAEVFEA